MARELQPDQIELIGGPMDGEVRRVVHPGNTLVVSAPTMSLVEFIHAHERLDPTVPEQIPFRDYVYRRSSTDPQRFVYLREQ